MQNDSDLSWQSSRKPGSTEKKGVSLKSEICFIEAFRNSVSGQLVEGMITNAIVFAIIDLIISFRP